MIHLIQIMKILNKEQRQLFVDLFNDLSFEIEEQGYLGLETDLVSDILFNHFGLEIECNDQLNMFTDCIIKHQYKLDKAVKGACMVGGI